MELAVDGWRNELMKYFRSVENQTLKALVLIKRDRTRNNLPFDDAFKTFFLDRTNSRIANAYTNFEHEDRFEDEVGHGTAGSSSQHLLTLSTISPESIEQMPVILVPPYNPMSDQIIISMPSNQPSSVPLDAEIDQNSEQAYHAQSTKSIAVVEEPRMERGMTAEQLETNANEGNDYAATPHIKKLIQPALPTGVHIKSNSQRISTDRTADRATNNYEQHQEDDTEPAEEVQDDSNMPHPKVIDSMSSRQDPEGNIALKVNENFGDKSRYSMKRPQSTSTVEEKRRHKCQYCDYSAEHKSKLTRHMRTHTNDRPYECEVCKRSFTIKHNLNRHMKTHRSLFEFQCSICRRGFSNEKQQKSHESSCKIKRYQCHLCKKIFLEKRSLVDHMRKHTGEKLRCSICREKFSANRSLAFHMKSHGKLFRFQCSKCRRGFSHKTPWNLHESRCKSKQFECFLCGKKCHQKKSDLLRHMRHKHTGEQPFGCPACPMQFCRKEELVRHTKRCHLNDK